MIHRALAAALAVLLFAVAAEADAVADGVQLLQLRQACAVTRLASWQPGTSPCGATPSCALGTCPWEGIVCTSGSVSEVHLAGLGLQGPIPQDCAPPASVTTLDLSNNPDLCGLLPPGITAAASSGITILTAATGIGAACTHLSPPLQSGPQLPPVAIAFIAIGSAAAAAALITAAVLLARRRWGPSGSGGRGCCTARCWPWEPGHGQGAAAGAGTAAAAAVGAHEEALHADLVRAQDSVMVAKRRRTLSKGKGSPLAAAAAAGAAAAAAGADLEEGGIKAGLTAGVPAGAKGEGRVQHPRVVAFADDHWAAEGHRAAGAAGGSSRAGHGDHEEEEVSPGESVRKHNAQDSVLIIRKQLSLKSERTEDSEEEEEEPEEQQQQEVVEDGAAGPSGQQGGATPTAAAAGWGVAAGQAPPGALPGATGSPEAQQGPPLPRNTSSIKGQRRATFDLKQNQWIPTAD